MSIPEDDVLVGLPVHLAEFGHFGAALLAQDVVMSELHRVAVGDLDEGPIALRTGGRLRRRARRRDAHRGEGRWGRRRHRDGRRRLRRWSGDGHRRYLRIRRPAVVREPAAYDDGHQADQQGEHYVYLRVACTKG